MRLQRFYLTRYGHFTDFVLDFGEKLPDRPDFHLIYGPNEAGKSTAFSGYLDLLYGIPRNSRYDFRHGEGTMQVAADLAFRDGIRHFQRVKKLRDSLLDRAGKILPEQAILSELGGVTRDQYKQMFVLDNESLESGGNSILESRSDLGQLLFSATSGLGGINQHIAKLHEEADELYRKRASKTAIAEAKRAIAELDGEIRKIDTSSAAYAALVEARDKAERCHQEALKAQSLARSGLDLAHRQGRAMGLLAEWQTLRSAIAKDDGAAALTEALVERVLALEPQRITLEARASELAREIADCQTERDAIAQDEAALSIADKHGSLHQLRGRHAASREDLPKRRSACDEALLDLKGIIQQVGLPPDTPPETVPLPFALTSELRTLMGQRNALDAKRELHLREAQRAERELEDAEITSPGLSGPALDEETASALETMLETLREAGITARLHGLQREVRREETRTDRAMEALLPWRGDGNALRGMFAPEEATVQQLRHQRDNAATACENARRELDELSRKRDGAAAATHAITTDTGLLSDADKSAIRQARDAAWERHRRALDAATAEAFEVVMRQDDAAGAAQLGHAQRSAELARLRQEVLAADILLGPARDRASATQGALQNADAKIAALIGGISPEFPPGFGIPELTQWLQRRSAAVEVLARLDDLRRDLAEAEQDERAAIKRMVAALEKAGLAAPNVASLDALMQSIRTIVSASRDALQYRRKLDRCRIDIERWRAAIVEINDDLSKWQGRWEHLLSTCWLGRLASALPPADVQKILDIIEPAPGIIAKWQEAQHRITAMEQDDAAFRVALVELAHGLGINPDRFTTDQLDQHLQERIAKAQSARERHDDAERRLDRALGLQQELGLAQSDFHAKTDDILAELAVPDLPAALAAVEAGRRRAELEHRARDIEEKLLAELHVADIETATQALGGLDEAGLAVNIASFEAQLQDSDADVPAAFAAFREARRNLDAVGGDDAVARLRAHRRTKLIEIEALARRYLALQAGAIATERALRQFRDQHRSTMLQSASEAFSIISRGAYAGLATQPGHGGEVLVTVDAGGGSKLASELSTGTRFQLYLALRIAGYREFTAIHPSVPFIADDILETFDNDRTSETLRLLSDLAHVGQVICFTHHTHVCDLARDVAPSVQIHTLVSK